MCLSNLNFSTPVALKVLLRLASSATQVLPTPVCRMLQVSTVFLER